MADVLSQSEVESLLAALDPGTTSTPDADPMQGFSGEARQDSISFAGQISVYDFKRPERVSKEQMRAFQALHEVFSREFGATLSGILRSIVEVKLISVDQLTYSEFVFSLENPTCFNLLESDNLNGHIILDLNPAIIFPIVDRLLGGGKDSRQGFPNRPLTEIELRLVSRITSSAMAALDNAWANICELNLRVTQVESNPQLVQIVPPNEVIVLVSFEITMGENRGIMNLCIPFNTIEPLSGKLSSDTWSSYARTASDPRQKLNLKTGISSARVSMSVQLSETGIKVSEMVGLAVGDVIVTDNDQNQGMIAMIEGRPMFTCSPGLYKGHKAIRVNQRISRPKEQVEAELKTLPETEQPTTEEVKTV